jgi:hypothetical protein
MRVAYRIAVVALTVGLVLSVGACAGNSLDDTGSPNVVLEIFTVTIPPITATTASGVCTFTVTTGNATLRNEPKNSLAITSPFNDVKIDSVSIIYNWDDGLVWAGRDLATGALQSTGTGIIESAAGTIPANASNGVTFVPILFGDLDVSRAGHSANMVMQFHGRTPDGTSVWSLPGSPGGGVLMVASCPP